MVPKSSVKSEKSVQCSAESLWQAKHQSVLRIYGKNRPIFITDS